MEIIPRYEKKSLSDVVVSYVENKVLSGALKSGDKLVEADISKELNTSRAPVREALRILNEQGMTTFSPRKGNHVLEMSQEEILEVFEIRVSLEMQILYLLVTQSRLNERDYEKLVELTRQMEHGEERCSTEEERVFLLNQLDLEFHSYLWDVSGSVRRTQLLKGLFFQLLIIMNQDTASLGSFQEKAKEHMRIIEALRTNELDRVHEEFRAHLQTYIVAALSGAESGGEKASIKNIPINIRCYI